LSRELRDVRVWRQLREVKSGGQDSSRGSERDQIEIIV